MSKEAHNHIDDAKLLEWFYESHNSKWLGILLERYTMLLLGVCMKYLKDEEEARDAVQQVFLKVITELPKHRVTFFKSWLYMVARNVCLMRLRSKNGRIPAELTDHLCATESFAAADMVEKEQTLTFIEAGLHELNSEQRECVSLFYLQGKSYKQITDLTGFTLLQVKSHIQNGKRNLKLIVERKIKANG